MLLEKNQVVIGLVVAAVLGVATVFAVAVSGGMFKPGLELSAEFEDAAGLKKGSFVFVAGVQAGQVLDVQIDEEKNVALARFTLRSDGVPEDSHASVILQNTLGKRAIRLTPGNAETFFEGGDHIPVARTSTPIDLPELGDRSSELLGNVNAQALQDVMTALADVTEDKEQDVEALIDGLQRVTEIVADRKEELRQVILRAEEVVDAAAEKDQEIVRIIDAIGTTLDTLIERRADIERLLVETARSSTLTADLIDNQRAQLDRVLFELHEDLEIIDDHQVDLALTMAYMGYGVDGFRSIGYQDGDAKNDNPTWGNVFTTNLGQAGVQAILGCGGTFDELFTQLIGPDPRCEDGPPQGNTTEEPSAGSQDGGGNQTQSSGSSTEPEVPEAPSTDVGGLQDFFDRAFGGLR